MARPAWCLTTFLRDRLPLIGIGLLCIGAVAGILAMTRATTGTIVLVVAVLATGLAAMGAVSYARDKNFWRQLADFSDDPASARVIPSLLAQPGTMEARLAHEALRAQGGAATDELNAIRNETDAYRRYIELWVHQVKAPLASAQLTLGQMHGPEADSVRADIARIEAQVEQALYCSRAQTVRNDYLIREVRLVDVVNAVVRRQARRMIQAGVLPRVSLDGGESVLADEKWLAFILGQIVDNSVKYGARSVEFSSGACGENTADGMTWLRIADGGDGIPAEDVPRVFDRGFTGAAGRAHHPATGMGLYLVACACRDLGLGLELESEEGTGTAITISFPQDRRRMDLASAANLTQA